MDPRLIEAFIPITAIVMGCLIILIPVAGFTARFAFKPIAEAMARMREGGVATREVGILEQRVALLESQIQNIESSVDRLAAAKDFDRQLTSGRTV